MKQHLRFRLISCIFTVIILVSVLLPARQSHAQSSLIPDTALERVIRLSIGKSQGDLSEDDLLKVKQIYAFQGEGIRSLEGLQYATNLTKLIVSNQPQLSDLSPIAGLDKLTFVDISHTQVSDLTPLSGLSHLYHLGATQAQITTLEPLKNLHLGELFVANNEIADLTPVASMDLVWLDAADNQIVTLPPLLLVSENWRYVFLSNNHISDATSLVVLSGPDTIYIEGNPLDTMSISLMAYYENEGVKVKYDKTPPVSVELNGKRLDFKGQAAVIDNGNTLVPMRDIFTALGAEITWNAAERSVTGKKGGSTIKLTIDSYDALVNGKSKRLEVAPVLLNQTTMVPIRVISEGLGAKVTWDSAARTVRITSASSADGQKPAASGGTPSAQEGLDLHKPVKQAWAYDSKLDLSQHPDQNNTSYTPPIVADGKIFYSDNFNIYSVRSDDARTEWKIATNEFASGLLLRDQTLYFSDSDSFNAVDAATGKQRWRTSKSRITLGRVLEVSQDKVFYVEEQGFTALDRQTGQIRWTYEDSFTGGHVLVNDKQLIVGTAQGEVVALDANTGNKAWSIKSNPYANPDTAALFGIRSLAVDQNLLIVGSLESKLRAFDLNTREEKWSKPLNDAIYSMVVKDGIVYYTDSSSNTMTVHALNVSTGTELWKISLPGHNASIDRMSVYNDTVLVSSYTSGTTYAFNALDAATGTMLWEQPELDSYFNPSTVGSDGLYTTDSRGILRKWVQAP